MDDQQDGAVEVAGSSSKLKRVEQEVLRTLVVNSVQRVLAWTVAAAVPFVYGLFRLLYHERSSAVLVAAGLTVVLLVPPVVGFIRSRTLRRARKAETENKRLRAENASLRSSAKQAVRCSQVLADWLTDTLVDAYRPHNVDPDRDFETWLNDILIKVMNVMFPEQGTVALAVISERDGMYSITHRSAGLPEPILRIDPAPVHRPLAECISRHTPNAHVSYFVSGDEKGWVAFFPERPFDKTIQGSQLASIAAMVAHVYTTQGFPVAAAA